MPFAGTFPSGGLGPEFDYRGYGVQLRWNTRRPGAWRFVLTAPDGRQYQAPAVHAATKAEAAEQARRAVDLLIARG